MLVDNGHIIASVAYRLSCTQIDGREMLADLRDAVEYVSRNAHQWGGDGSRIVLVGTSAGGNLALLTAYRQRLPSIIGVVSLYGVTELREEKLSQPRTGQSLFEQLSLTIFSRATRHVCAISDAPETCFSEMSPLAYLEAEHKTPRTDQPPIPPTLMIHGLEDPLVFLNQAKWLQQRLEILGVPHALVQATGSHDCDVLVSSPCGQAALKSLAHFLAFLEQG
jgi:acetyl esterase/lipase